MSKTITVIGRRWTQKSTGNTYCSVDLYVGAKHIVKTEPEYGYGEHYKTIAFDQLVRLGAIKDRLIYDNGGQESLWQYCDRKNIKLIDSVCDITREKDL